MAIKKSRRILPIILTVVMVFSMHVAFPDTANAATSFIPTIAAGGNHSLTHKNDGTVRIWGNNGTGQLGNGTTETAINPIQFTDFNGVTAIAGGGNHSIALKSDGTAWTWGQNLYGQLGDGTFVNKTSPVQVVGLTGVIAVAAGGETHTLALKSDGTVWAWGPNNFGQLGDGTSGIAASKNTPVKVIGLSDVAAIAGGGYHSLALKSDGTVWAWGFNVYGQIGNGTTGTAVSAPVQVKGLTGVVAVAGGYDHSLALKSDGTVWSWGHNNVGQLGIDISGAGTDKSSPMQVKNLSGVTAIASGYYHSLAVKSDGTVRAWGYNLRGQLGDSTNSDKSSPVQVNNLINVSAITAGMEHSIALKNDGTVWSWGRNNFSQLGDGSDTNKTTPVQVKGEGGSGYLSLGATYKVTLNSNGGNYGTSLVWGAPGAAMPRIIPPTRPGYIFGGYWNTSAASGGKQYYKATGFSANDWDNIENATLWARWTSSKSGGVNGGNKTGASIKVKAVKTLPAVYIAKGKSVTLPAAVQPYNAANKKVAFKSKDKKIAKVTSTGKIKGLKTGKTTITIITKDGNKKATCKVYVVKKAVKLKKLTLNQKAKVSLTKGKTLDVKAKLSPAKATGIVPKFTSGNTSVAVIDKAGMITALKAGSTTITVKAGKLKKTIKLTVK